MTESEYAKLQDLARVRGHEHGRAAASWLFDGNTPDRTYREWLDRWMECDLPDDWSPRSPLSGEWAGESPREILSGILDNVTDPEDELAIMDAYEGAYYEAWYSAVESTCRYMLGEDDNATA